MSSLAYDPDPALLVDRAAAGGGAGGVGGAGARGRGGSIVIVDAMKEARREAAAEAAEGLLKKGRGDPPGQNTMKPMKKLPKLKSPSKSSAGRKSSTTTTKLPKTKNRTGGSKKSGLPDLIKSIAA
jgi:hypothetical protein